MFSIFSFFSGVGFLDLGFEKSGFDVVHVNEYSKSFLNAYKYARTQMNINEPKYGYFCGSIEDCLHGMKRKDLEIYIEKERRLRSIVGFIGGPPCPDFSIGGKNKGKYGENGKLSQTYIDLICELKPDFFFFENVKGLLKTKKHKEFYHELQNKLIANGYILTDQLVNAIQYGVAQDRERIMMLGISNKIHSSRCMENFDWSAHVKYIDKSAFEYDWANLSNIPEELTIKYWFERNDVKNHFNTNHCFVPKAGLSKFKVIKEGDVSGKSYKRLHRYRYSPTVAYGNNEVHIHPVDARRINVAEALAIQSLPGEFVLPDDMTLSDMFKAISNGVPYIVAYKIAQNIKHFIENSYARN